MQDLEISISITEDNCWPLHEFDEFFQKCLEDLAQS